MVARWGVAVGIIEKSPCFPVSYAFDVCPQPPNPASLTASGQIGTDDRLSGMPAPGVAGGKLAQQIGNNRRILSSGTALRGFQRLNYPE